MLKNIIGKRKCLRNHSINTTLYQIWAKRVDFTTNMAAMMITFHCFINFNVCEAFVLLKIVNKK